MDPLWASPLRLRHQEIERFGIRRHIPRETDRRQLLFGPGRVTKYPLMALKTDKELGDCRHALAQRVVAGVEEVNWVFPAGDGKSITRTMTDGGKIAVEKTGLERRPRAG